MITTEDIGKITKAVKPLPDLAIKYLKNRGLEPTTDMGFIYEHKINDLQTPKLSISLPIRSLTGKIQGYEFRPISKLASDRYSKTFTDNLIAVYNIRNKNFSQKVIATEGIFDCESIYQGSNLNVIALLKATPANHILHILAFMYIEIRLVLDSDVVGLKGAKNIKKFFKEFYPDIEVIMYNISDYTKNKNIKDPNDLKVKDPSGFKKLIKDLQK